MLQFTHLLIEAKSKYSPNIKPYLKTHDIIDSIDGFSHITFNYNILPPIRIKTKPSIFIMKRKPNIKYDLYKSKSSISVKNSSKQMDNEENVDFNMSRKVTIESKFHNIVESSEEFGRLEKTSEQNLSDTKVNKKISESINNTKEEERRFLNLVDDNAISMKNTTTWKIEDTNKLSPNSKDETEQNLDFESVSSIHDAKLDEKIKTKIEEEKIVKEKPKNGLKRQETRSGTKKMVKRIIQEKIQEDKQKQEAERPRKTKTFKQEIKNQIVADESVLTDQIQDKIKVVNEHAKDGKQRNINAKDTIPKTNKIRIAKPINLEKIAENEDLNKDKIVDVTIKKKIKSQDSVHTELSEYEREIVEEKGKEDIKSSKLINVRKSIKNIINQFKEFEKHFIYDNIDSMTSTNDVSHANHIQNDLYITETDNSIMDHSMKNEDQELIKDARESFREILEQFKYIKDELTSEEDDQFDEIAAKYMEQPIAETLLQFSEALKALMQRRRKILPEQAADLYDNEDDISDVER